VLRYRTPSTLQTAIASPQLPNIFFNEPQRHRGHRERAIALPQPPQTAIALLQLPKQRSHSSNSPNSDRTPPTPQTAIALPPLPKQRSHSLNSPNSDRTPQLPNSDRTPSTSQYPFLTNHRDTENTEKERSHSLQLPQTTIAPPQFPNSDRTSSIPKHPFLTNHRDTEKERSHSLNFPKSDRTPSS
jgi:hypothetical protein